jgi:transposase
MQHTIGIDVSKDALDIHRRMDGATLQLGNDRPGFRRLLKDRA